MTNRLKRVLDLVTTGRQQEDYLDKLVAASQHGGEHLKVEASGVWNAWLDHPLINEHYRQLMLIDGLPWEGWAKRELGGPAEKSLDLGCGAGARSISVFKSGASKQIEGCDISGERVAEGERERQALGAPGRFQVADINEMELPELTYDLIFSCHSFHYFLELEHIMHQVHQALTPSGLFILEAFVGPTQFQWTDQQIEMVQALLALLPESLRTFHWGALKHLEGRPTPAEVVAASPFESIRSADIFPLFQEYFQLVAIRPLGGTIQHLLYNGIMHNFSLTDEAAQQFIRGVYSVEDSLIEAGMLPSDFMLLVGRRKS